MPTMEKGIKDDMQPINDAENLFLEEVRAKKKETASWRSSQKHKRMGKGSIRFASDFMNPKERKEHRRASTVTTTNIFDEILTREQFEGLETFEKKNRMQYWRAKFTIKEIQQAMGISNGDYYKIINILELPKDRSHSKPRTPRKSRVTSEALKQPLEAFIPKPEETPAPVQQVIVNGMHLIFNGTYSPEELQRQLLKYAGLLDGESDEFYIELKLVQKASEK